MQTLLKVGYGPIRNVTFSSIFFSRSYAIFSVIISISKYILKDYVSSSSILHTAMKKVTRV